MMLRPRDPARVERYPERAGEDSSQWNWTANRARLWITAWSLTFIVKALGSHSETLNGQEQEVAGGDHELSF